MILVTLKPWQKIEGITHVKTNWEIATDMNFETIIESEESSTMLETYFSNLFVPIGVTYYVKATRIYNNGTTSTLDPIAVVNYGSKQNDVVLSEDTIIDVPFVYLNKEDITNNAENIHVTTSEFRCSADDHSYTHWIIMDGTGDVLYSNLYDKVNKLSIDIPNSYVYKNKTTLYFIAIHGSECGVESPAGKKIVNLTADYNFEINNAISWVEPLKDFNIVLTVIDKTKPINVFKVELLDYATEEILLTLTNNGSDTYLVPFYYLQEGTKYKIKIYAYDSDMRYGAVIKTLQTASPANTIVRNPSYEYENKLEESIIENPTAITVPFYSEALLDMQILVPKKDRTIEVFTSEDIHMKTSKTIAPGIRVLSENPEYTLIKPVTKSLVVMDTPSATGVPTFMVYGYENHNNLFTLKSTLEREDETICMGKRNSFVQINSSEFIYNPVGTNKLKIWNIVSNTIKELEPIPEDGIGDFSKGILLRVGDNCVLCANGNSYTTKLYDYTTNEYRNGITFGPNSFIGADLRVLNLINGNSLIIKTTPVTDDTESSAVVFDYQTFDFVDTKVKFTKEYPDITIVCGFGHGHMYKYIPEVTDDFIGKSTPDRFDCMTFL